MDETITEYTDLIYGAVEDTLDRHGKMFFRKDVEQYLRDVWAAARKQALADAAKVNVVGSASSDEFGRGWFRGVEDTLNALEALV